MAKPVDKSSPLLHQALTLNTTLPQVKFAFYRPSPTTGLSEHFFTIELQNANIVSVRRFSAPEPGGAEDREVIAFTYQKIIWTWVDGGIMSMDEWLAGRK